MDRFGHFTNVRIYFSLPLNLDIYQEIDFIFTQWNKLVVIPVKIDSELCDKLIPSYDLLRTTSGKIETSLFPAGTTEGHQSGHVRISSEKIEFHQVLYTQYGF